MSEKTVSNANYKNRSPVKRKAKENIGKGPKFKEKFSYSSEEKIEDEMQKPVIEIVTGNGRAVPMCDGEEMVS